MKELVLGIIATVFFSLSASSQTEYFRGDFEGLKELKSKGVHGCHNILINDYTRDIVANEMLISSIKK
ncbi:hypothetical protein [Flavobacterium sp. N1994]|uniref:hypothetical protein n=1 Tax=Flavobacterium sp. N1994 TaxID=2986827 RepID=UPI0022219A9C|nr:hypothetical protein [Flavobacterium sp. N1994]